MCSYQNYILSTANHYMVYPVFDMNQELRNLHFRFAIYLVCRITCWQCNWGSRPRCGVHWNTNCSYGHGSYWMVYSARPYRGSSGCYTALLPAQEEKERTFIVSYHMLFWCCNIKLTLKVKNVLQSRSLICPPFVKCCFKFLPFIYNDMLKWWENDACFTA